MLINSNSTMCEHVKFVEYTGHYPNLCSGVLTLEIDGEIVKFGHDYTKYDYKTNKFNDGSMYDSFWSSGGHLDRNYCAHQAEWQIDVEAIPEQYRKYATEIDEVFNNNVPHGCCGGCA